MLSLCSPVEYKTYLSEIEPKRLPPSKPRAEDIVIAPAPVPSAIHRSSSLPRTTPGSSITLLTHPVGGDTGPSDTSNTATFLTERY